MTAHEAAILFAKAAKHYSAAADASEEPTEFVRLHELGIDCEIAYVCELAK